MSSEFKKVREQSASTLALLKTRIDETDGIAHEADLIENTNSIMRNAGKLVSIAAILLIIFAVLLIVFIEALIFFPDTLELEIFAGVKLMFLAVALLAIVLLFAVVYSLVAICAKVKANDFKKVNVDLYRVQQDKIEKLKRLNKLIVNEVANVCNIAVDVENDNYNLAHEAYLESLHDLEDQMNNIEAANVSIQQKIHEYHNERNALMQVEHKKVLDTIHELYVKQVRAFQTKYQAFMEKKNAEFSQFATKANAEITALKNRKEVLLNHDGSDISYDQLLIEPGRLAEFTNVIEENINHDLATANQSDNTPEQPVTK
jgi:hypothetical protein